MSQSLCVSDPPRCLSESERSGQDTRSPRAGATLFLVVAQSWSLHALLLGCAPDEAAIDRTLSEAIAAAPVVVELQLDPSAYTSAVVIPSDPADLATCTETERAVPFGECGRPSLGWHMPSERVAVCIRALEDANAIACCHGSDDPAEALLPNCADGGPSCDVVLSSRPANLVATMSASSLPEHTCESVLTASLATRPGERIPVPLELRAARRLLSIVDIDLESSNSLLVRFTWEHTESLHAVAEACEAVVNAEPGARAGHAVYRHINGDWAVAGLLWQ